NDAPARLDVAVILRRPARKEELHLEDAPRRLDVLAADRAADRRDVDAELFGEVRHLEGLEVGDAVVEEARLDLDDRLGDPKKRRLALPNRREEPFGVVDLLLEVLLDRRILLRLLVERPVVIADLDARQVIG